MMRCAALHGTPAEVVLVNQPADKGKLITVLLKVCRGRELPGYMGGRSRPRTGPPRGNSLRRNDSSSMTSHCSHDLSHTDDGLPNRPDRALDNRHSKEHEPATGASCQRSRKLSSPIFRKDGHCRTGSRAYMLDQGPLGRLTGSLERGAGEIFRCRYPRTTSRRRDLYSELSDAAQRGAGSWSASNGSNIPGNHQNAAAHQTQQRRHDRGWGPRDST